MFLKPTVRTYQRKKPGAHLAASNVSTITRENVLSNNQEELRSSTPPDNINISLEYDPFDTTFDRLAKNVKLPPIPSPDDTEQYDNSSDYSSDQKSSDTEHAYEALMDPPKEPLTTRRPKKKFDDSAGSLLDMSVIHIKPSAKRRKRNNQDIDENAEPNFEKLNTRNANRKRKINVPKRKKSKLQVVGNEKPIAVYNDERNIDLVSPELGVRCCRVTLTRLPLHKFNETLTSKKSSNTNGLPNPTIVLDKIASLDDEDKPLEYRLKNPIISLTRLPSNHRLLSSTPLGKVQKPQDSFLLSPINGNRLEITDDPSHDKITPGKSTDQSVELGTAPTSRPLCILSESPAAEPSCLIFDDTKPTTPRVSSTSIKDQSKDMTEPFKGFPKELSSPESVHLSLDDSNGPKISNTVPVEELSSTSQENTDKSFGTVKETLKIIDNSDDWMTISSTCEDLEDNSTDNSKLSLSFAKQSIENLSLLKTSSTCSAEYVNASDVLNTLSNTSDEYLTVEDPLSLENNIKNPKSSNKHIENLDSSDKHDENPNSLDKHDENPNSLDKHDENPNSSDKHDDNLNSSDKHDENPNFSDKHDESQNSSDTNTVTFDDSQNSASTVKETETLHETSEKPSDESLNLAVSNKKSEESPEKMKSVNKTVFQEFTKNAKEVIKTSSLQPVVLLTRIEVPTKRNKSTPISDKISEDSLKKDKYSRKLRTEDILSGESLNEITQEKSEDEDEAFRKSRKERLSKKMKRARLRKKEKQTKESHKEQKIYRKKSSGKHGKNKKILQTSSEDDIVTEESFSENKVSESSQHEESFTKAIKSRKSFKELLRDVNLSGKLIREEEESKTVEEEILLEVSRKEEEESEEETLVEALRNQERFKKDSAENNRRSSITQPIILLTRLRDPVRITERRNKYQNWGSRFDLSAIPENQTKKTITAIPEEQEEFEMDDTSQNEPYRIVTVANIHEEPKVKFNGLTPIVSEQKIRDTFLTRDDAAKIDEETTVRLSGDTATSTISPQTEDSATFLTPNDVSKIDENKEDKIFYLKPGKSWSRSLSILSHISNDDDLDVLGVGKGRKWRESVQNILEMQPKGLLQSCVKKNEDRKESGSYYGSQNSATAWTPGCSQPCQRSRNSTAARVPRCSQPETNRLYSVGSPTRFVRRVSIRVVPDSKNFQRIEDTPFLEAYGITASENRKTLVERSSLIAPRITEVYNVQGTDINFEKLSKNINNVTSRDVVLAQCGQRSALPFGECYSESFLNHCRKIGEGVYGEVFLYDDGAEKNVIKIIPIEGDLMVNNERQKKFDEILSEIVIAKELHNLRFTEASRTSGFVEVKHIRCVIGQYPKKLVQLWKTYDEEKNSENDCPSMFDDDQLYIVLELGHGGEDLEAFVFQNASEAHALFIQAALALAVAEDSLEFEHRDLHWGNMLIARTEDRQVTYKLRNKDISVASKGVKVSVIDFTLSRLSYQGCSIFNDLAMDEDLFSAHGEYQFEVYRLMRHKVENNWQRFEPYTNILWLHYTLDKMITQARYKTKGSKRHGAGIKQLKQLKNVILNYDSVVDFVTNCDKATRLQESHPRV